MTRAEIYARHIRDVEDVSTCRGCGTPYPCDVVKLRMAPNLALHAALEDWQADYDDGWGDRFESEDFAEGGFTLWHPGQDHTRKEFRLLRALL